MTRPALTLGTLVLQSLLALGAAGAQATPACGWQGSHEWLSTRPSPLDSATITVGNATVRICYSRPSLRTRDLDSLVPAGRTWRTGANEPTTLVTTARVDVGGALLEPGRYVILTVPREDRWQFLFHTTSETEPARMFGALQPVATGIGAVERSDAHVERFTIRPADAGAAALLLEWGTRRIQVPIRAAP